MKTDELKKIMDDMFGDRHIHISDNEITKEDVYKVANDLCIGITDEQVRQVLELYPIEAEEDKTATWDLIVENLIYNLKTK